MLVCDIFCWEGLRKLIHKQFIIIYVCAISPNGLNWKLKVTLFFLFHDCTKNLTSSNDD